MATSKLIHAMRTLKNDEWSSFKKYLQLHFRPSSDSFLCFQVIHKQKDNLYLADCEENMRLKHFPKMTAKAYSNMLSKLFGHFENWFAGESFLEEKYSKQLQLVKGYNERGLFKLANQTAQKLEKEIMQAEYLDVDQEKTLAQLYHTQYFSNNPIKKDKGSILLNQSITHFSNSMNEYALGYVSEIENRTILKKESFQEARNKLTSITHSLPDSKLSSLLQDGYKLLKTNDLSSFHRIEQALENEVIDPSSDLYAIFSVYLRRACHGLILKGKIDKSRLLEVIQYSFLATEKNRNLKFLQKQLFNNVSTLGSFLSYSDTEAFICQWIDSVHTGSRDSTLSYCKALNAFRHDKYELIPSLLQGLVFDTPYYKIESNVLLIIAHYKLGEDALTHNLIQNFKKQQKRNKENITKANYKALENLIEVILLLMRARYDKSVKINIDDYEDVFYRSWVLKQQGI